MDPYSDIYDDTDEEPAFSAEYARDYLKMLILKKKLRNSCAKPRGRLLKSAT